MTGIQYIKAFCEGATQLGGIQNGARYHRMGVGLDDAIENPAEAKRLDDSEIFATLLEAM